MFIQTRNFQIAKIASQANDNMEGAIVTDRLLTLSCEQGLDVRSFGEWVKPTESKTKYKVGEKSYSSNEIVALMASVEYPYDLPVVSGGHRIGADLLVAAITGAPVHVREYVISNKDSMDIAELFNVQHNTAAKLQNIDRLTIVQRHLALGQGQKEICKRTNIASGSVKIAIAQAKAISTFGILTAHALSIPTRKVEENGVVVCRGIQAIVADNTSTKKEVTAELELAVVSGKPVPTPSIAAWTEGRNTHDNALVVALYDALLSKSVKRFELATTALEAELEVK